MALDVDSTSSHEQLAQVSREVVQLLAKTTGRGPKKCRADYANRDLLVVTLTGAALESERTLAEAGQAQTVAANRAALQEVLEERLSDIVERATGREVVAFLSANHTDPEIMLEAFVLESAQTEGVDQTS